MGGTKNGKTAAGNNTAWHNEISQLENDLHTIRSIYRDIHAGIKRTLKNNTPKN
ncbi:hypothetical protein [Nocardia nova]|uniref:hypothetical protein n=1 Tax=Nocardia nova TaxID=37330 RepID=UPI0033EF87F6